MRVRDEVGLFSVLEAPSLHQTIGWIAQLGGFPGLKSDADPSPTPLWRGLLRLQGIAEAYLVSLSKPISSLTIRLVGNAKSPMPLWVGLPMHPRAHPRK